MKAFRLLIAAFVLFGLAACYTSDKPLVSDDDAVTPFEKITFLGKDAGDKPLAFARDGKAYFTSGDDGTKLWLRFKPVEGDYYVAQLSGTEVSAGNILYGYIRIDQANKVADTWRTVGTEADVRPGFRKCGDSICVDDLSVYIAYAKEAIAAGTKPDTTYQIEIE